MTSVSIIIFIILIIVASVIKDKIDDAKMSKELNNKVTMPIKFNPESEVLSVLRELNCTPESFSYDDYVDIRFNYQGENLIIRLQEDFRIAKIIDPCWYQFNKSDIDKYAETQKAINELNKRYIGTSLFYSTDDKTNDVYVYSIDRFLISNDSEETKHGIKIAISSFFSVHHDFHKELISKGIDV